MPIGGLVKVQQLDLPFHRQPGRDRHRCCLRAQPRRVVRVLGFGSYHRDLLRRHQAHGHLHARREGAVAERKLRRRAGCPGVVNLCAGRAEFVVHPHGAVLQRAVHRELAHSVADAPLGDAAVAGHVPHLNDAPQVQLVLQQLPRAAPAGQPPGGPGVSRGQERRALALEHGAEGGLQVGPHLPSAQGDLHRFMAGHHRPRAQLAGGAWLPQRAIHEHLKGLARPLPAAALREHALEDRAGVVARGEAHRAAVLCGVPSQQLQLELQLLVRARLLRPAHAARRVLVSVGGRAGDHADLALFHLLHAELPGSGRPASLAA
mmetsp:Transcript_41826/g.108278  ORF Transcript_41826/g.108278 Transcript_41826/m.108278 type:complete len:319 (-) Transcript_41826:434-1390(-)